VRDTDWLKTYWFICGLGYRLSAISH